MDLRIRLSTALKLPAALWYDRHSLKWLSDIGPSIAYLGWVGRGNVGDDLMFGVHERILSGTSRHPVMPAPLHRPTVALLSRRPSHQPSTILMGGGTLLLQDEWLRRLVRVRHLWPEAKLIIYGAGAEDPGFGTRMSVTTKECLRAWSSMLKTAQYIGVRGPRSAAALREMDLEAQVVGDPGLVGPVGGSPDPVVDVALNLTSVPALAGIPSYRLRVADCIRMYVDAGLSVAVFGMDGGDVRATARLLQAADIDLSRVAGVWTRLEPLSTIAKSRLVISERLHGAIYAAACDVPFMHLAYKPKSFDFLESIRATSLGIGPHDEELQLPDVSELPSFSNFYGKSIKPRVARLRALFMEKYVELISSN